MIDLQEGDAVKARGSDTVGLVTGVDLSRMIAWVRWPVGSGLPQDLSITVLEVVIDADTMLRVLEEFCAPALPGGTQRPGLGYRQGPLVIDQRRDEYGYLERRR
jgi:hypothetical protein